MNARTTLQVHHIMHREVLSAQMDWPLDVLARFLTDNQISGAPVTGAKGQLAGVVSLTDIVRHGSQPEGRDERQDTHEYYLQTRELQHSGVASDALQLQQHTTATVADIMTPMVFQVSENASVQEAADIMVRGHIHRLFVTKDKQVSGIVTAMDILATLRDLDAA